MTNDEWTTVGARIDDPEILKKIRDVIANESPVIVEHRFYRGARAPHRFVCDDVDEFDEYRRTKAVQGDSFFFWNFDACCTNANVLAAGKVPDAEGRTPTSGAY